MDKILEMMNRMGISVSTSNVYEKLFEEQPIFLNEGLITSYDSKMVLNAICDSFHLKKNGKEKDFIYTKFKDGYEYIYIGSAFLMDTESGEEEIKIILDTNESFISNIEQRMNKYGWSLYRQDKDLDNKTIFTFEKRFPTCFKPKHLLKFTDFIYHKTSKDIVNKILKQGLIPKESKSPGFKNEPRIYFWFDNDDSDDNLMKLKIHGDLITLEIDLNKLNPEHKFYFDNRMPSACFTMEPIPPQAIKVL